jgi:mannose-6-phosphate isomerase-like protein (cupin superfamily)
MRLVVTGHTPEGKAVVARDGVADALALGGPVYHRAWAADTAPSFPDDGAQPPLPGSHFPPVGGFRFGAFTLPAGGDVDLEAGTVDPTAVEAAFPGLLAHMDPDDPGMHRSATIDYLYVVSGDVVLELDDGVEVELRAGDACIQNGTRHRWRNPGAEPCTIVIAMLGAHHALA